MNQNKLRIGNITSSEIVALLSKPTAQKIKQGEIFGAPAKTYIAECNMERKLCRSITTESNARPLVWGKFLEKHVFDLLSTEYIMTSQETDQHPTIEYWAGSKDGIKHDEGKTVFDIKCPITLKSFCQFMDSFDENGNQFIQNIIDNHKDGEKYYWQLVSNAIINDCKYAELIIYVPYQKEFNYIKELALNDDKNNFIQFASEEDLPYLPNDCKHYKNLNIVRFEVKQEDKDFLTDRVIEAGKQLIKI